MNYDRLTKKELIKELTIVKKQLSKTLKTGRGIRQVGKREKRITDPKTSGPLSPAGQATERQYRVKDEDGTVRQIYEVVKDVHDEKGAPLYAEGALYEIKDKNSPTGETDSAEQTEIICRFRPDGTLTYVNEAYCRYFGCEREDFQDRNILLSISELDREKVLSKLQNLKPGSPVGTMECRVKTSFGEVLWNQWSYRAIFDGDGHVLEYHSVGRDITYRKYTQDVLEKRAAILEAMTAAAEGFLKSSAWADKIEPVLESFGNATGANHVFLFENDVNRQDRVSVRRRFEWFSPAISGVKARKKFLKTRDLATRFSRWIFAKSEGKPIYGTVGQFPDKEVESLALEPTLSIAVVPITVGGRWWGFIGFADYLNQIVWADDEIAPLEAAAGILGAAIERDEKEMALKEGERQFREQERFLSNVFDSIQDGIMVAAPDMTILRVNTTIEKRFPHVRTLVGRKCYEAYYGLKRPCKNCPCVETIKTGKAATWSHSIVGPDGECKGRVEAFSYPWIDDKTGQLKGVIEYSRDITERVKAEEELQKLASVVRYSKELINVASLDGQMTFINDAGAEMVGLSADEVEHTHILQVIPDHLQGKVKREIMPTLKKEGSWAGELQYRNLKTGRLTDVYASLFIIKDHHKGTPLFLANASTDITERKQAEERSKQSEERLRTFIDSTRDLVFLKDDKLRFIIANKACQDLLGLCEEDILGKTDFDFVPRESAKRWRKTDLEALATENGIIEAEDIFNGRTMRVAKFRMDLGNGRPGLATVVRDVTEQRAAEEAIRESERRLSDIINFLPDPTFVIDAGGRVMVWNRAMEETTGIAANDMIGKGDYEHSLCFYGERKPSLVDLVLKPDKKREKDFPSLKRKDGRLFAESYKPYSRTHNGELPIASVVASALYDTEGHVVGAIETFRDITDVKKAEASIREREAMLRSILRTAPIGISFGNDRTLKWTNSFYQGMSGYSEEELACQSTRQLYGSEKEYLDVGKALYGGIRKKGIGSAQAQWKRKDGSAIDVQLTMCPLYKKNPSWGVVVTALDVTERKKAEDALRTSEARYRELTDTIPVGVYETNLEGYVTYVNRTGFDLFGYGEDDLIKGLHFRHVIVSEEHDIAKENARCVKEGETVFFTEHTFLRKDGSRFTGLLSGKPLIRDKRLVGSTGVVTDISDLKKAQAALRKNEALLKGILQAAPIGIGIVYDRMIGWVNDHFTLMTGYASGDVIGKSARILYTDDEEFERVGREKYVQVRQGKTGAVETRWKRKDGTVFDLYLSSDAIDPQDLSAGVVFTAFDITDQKKAADILRFAKEELETQVTDRTRDLDITNMLLRVELEEHRKTEEALSKNEQLYRAIVEDQTELICRFHPDGTISFVNEAFCRFFGKNREELLETRFRPLIPREDREIMSKTVKALTPEDNVAQFEIRVEVPEKGLRWMLWTNRAIYDEAGRLIEHQAVGHDVTERIRSQHQIQESRNALRSVFDGISDPLLMVGEDLTVIMLNRVALEYFDAGHYRELIGLPCLGHLIDRYGRDHAERLKAAIEESVPSRFDLTVNLNAIRFEEVSIYPIRGIDDGRSLAIIRVTDRTKQVILERELIQNEKLASLGLLISGIVHEINNPNNFIVFNIPILRDYLREILPIVDEHAEKDPLYEVLGMTYTDFRVDVMKLLDNIEHGSHRINVTVAKLKEFSRKKEDKGLRAIASAEVINKALSICHTQIRKTVKTFDVEIDPALPPMTTDPEAIEQVLINLLINAAQAADKEDSLIRLHAFTGDSWKNRLIIEVIDNGCGMEATTASRVFDPFFTTKEEGCGTGLGLYISKNIVESAGGSITVESEPGLGTTFRVIFPDLESREPEKKNNKDKGVADHE